MKLTIFDLDNTILRGDSDYSWIQFLIEKEIVDVKKYKDKNDYFFNQYNQGTLDYTNIPLLQLVLLLRLVRKKFL